jgi:glyoxylase-like metal-dependent hydrolase (beta-lactamase superfamily II)
VKVRHLNCLDMYPPSARLVNGEGSLFGAGHMVCHCLLIEAQSGLILVDSALGSGDLADPRRLGRGFLTFARPRFHQESTALAQVERLGFRGGDVRHVVLTHLDVDHAGGIGDFPSAQIHVLEPELRAAEARATRHERQRYRPAQWAHGPKWVAHPLPYGEDWFGFARVRPLPDVEDDLLLIPLLGHTRGHAGVALRSDGEWLLHCGDAYFHHRELEAKPSCPAGLSFFQSYIEMDRALRLQNQARLRALAAGGEVRLFSAHDPAELLTS